MEINKLQLHWTLIPGYYISNRLNRGTYCCGFKSGPDNAVEYIKGLAEHTTYAEMILAGIAITLKQLDTQLDTMHKNNKVDFCNVDLVLTIKHNHRNKFLNQVGVHIKEIMESTKYDNYTPDQIKHMCESYFDMLTRPVKSQAYITPVIQQLKATLNYFSSINIDFEYSNDEDTIGAMDEAKRRMWVPVKSNVVPIKLSVVK